MILAVPEKLRTLIAGEHASIIVNGLAALQDGAAITMPRPGLLLLCYTNRCGSNYLAALLASTGAFNEAGEYFNADTVLFHANACHLPNLRAFAAHLPNLVEGYGDWLAAKASVDQIVMLADAGILDDWTPMQFVLLERRDRLGQAISRCIASQSGRWTTDHAARVPDGALHYDRAAIEAELARVALANAGFYLFFAANGIAPMHLAYEDIVNDPNAAVAGIGDGLGMHGLVADPSRVRIGRQANALNAAWRERYLTGA